MKRGAALFIVATTVICASPRAEASARIEAGAWLVGSGTLMDAAGEAQFYNSLSEPSAVPMTGNLTLLWYPLGTTPEIFTNWMWSTDSGYWGGSYQEYGQEGFCYYATIDAEVTFWSDGTTVTAAERSSDYCVPVLNPPPSGGYDTSELCPLILDINGDGIHTTGLSDAVYFWSRDGAKVASGWTNRETEEAFLWLDAPTDHQVTEAELFGSRMPAPDGGVHRNGFQALQTYDLSEHGGDGDGEITRSDRIWGRLRLRIDRNHDAVAQPYEISPLAAHSIVALSLRRRHDHTIDEHGNGVMLVGSYTVRRSGGEPEEREMSDIGFVYDP